MLGFIRQARTKAHHRTDADWRLSSPACTKPHVVRSPNVLSAKSKLENKVKTYEWFYGQLESLIKSANLALSRSDNSITYVGNIKLSTPNDTNKGTKKDKAL